MSKYLKYLIFVGAVGLAGCTSGQEAAVPAPAKREVRVIPMTQGGAATTPAQPAPADEAEEGEERPDYTKAPRETVVLDASGCWQYGGDKFMYEATFRKGMTVHMDFADDSGGYRDPVIMPLGANDEVVLDDDSRTLEQGVVQVGHDGRYLMTFAPRAEFGTNGTAKVCVK